MLVYVDTSALGRILVNHADRPALENYLDGVVARGDRLISSDLLDVELARLRVRMDLDPVDVERVCEGIHFMGILPEVVESAKDIEHTLKSLDAIHLGTALLLADEAEGEDAVEQVVTYDKRMVHVAEELGFEVVSPGRR
ncbi:putative nucleic acid-binding protein [Nocardioides luteus]|uniref:Ribonuclease VapC n=1 Tax=Nocardioides luteus TaxID=1844 RepID=A0ABQ5SYA8_9ACTN|nr:type II toxin-antitoxin system VapC family toxin [Nocardioides luteus]MDR7312538.1 putative nucleic acid-binding protein [Nocardioides luteus]GGR45791.1 ribonuclease VapC [Nocardioides luteus]GLJ68786.1 ribonuclease VapC [Nocardioides luteus]